MQNRIENKVLCGVRHADDEDLPLPRFHPAQVGRAGAGGQGQPPPKGVPPQEHQLHRGPRRLRRTRVQGHAQQRRTQVCGKTRAFFRGSVYFFLAVLVAISILCVYIANLVSWPQVQALQAGAADEPRGGVVRPHPHRPLLLRRRRVGRLARRFRRVSQSLFLLIS